jgi:8-oxo-dGTP diphosphatase
MSSRTPLSRYPRPSVAVDLAVLTVAPVYGSAPDVGTLAVLVLEGPEPDCRVLPGRFIRERRTVKESIAEILRLELELDPPANFSPTLLRVFDDPDRDERGWTMSLAHAVTVEASRVAGSAGRPAPVDAAGDLAGGERLAYDHNAIVREAVAAMRARYESAPDTDGLLPAPFTLAQLRHVHEAVLGDKLRKDTFNRRMREQLEPVHDESGEPLTSVRSVGRPAQLYRHRTDHRSSAMPPPSSLPRT